MSYKALRIFILSSLAVYLAAGLATNAKGIGSADVYPFFSWFLFYRTPDASEQALSIRILEYGGEPLAKPVLFGEPGIDPMLQPLKQMSRYSRMIQFLGRAVETEDAEGVRRFRVLLEQNFRKYPVRYEVVRLTYDPIERWRTGRIDAIEALAEFTADRK